MYYAKPGPSTTDLSPSGAVLSPLLLFAVASVTWLLAVIAQVLLYYGLRLKWVKDECVSYVDLLSVANVSCLVLDDGAHGYYLHGRSVHAFSDTTLAGMNGNLKAEQDKLTATRGLLPDTDLQIFEVYLTPQLAVDIRQLFFILVHQERAGSAASSFVDSAVRALSFRAQVPAPELIRAHKAMSAFIRGFIERTEKQHEYDVQKERQPIQKLLDVPPDLSAAGAKTLFFPVRRGFLSAFLMGVEYDIMLFGIFLFTLVTWHTANPMAGLLTAFVLELVFVKLRAFFGERNVSFKTLADSRFLI
jgi:meckelin